MSEHEWTVQQENDYIQSFHPTQRAHVAGELRKKRIERAEEERIRALEERVAQLENQLTEDDQQPDTSEEPTA